MRGPTAVTTVRRGLSSEPVWPPTSSRDTRISLVRIDHRSCSKIYILINKIATSWRASIRRMIILINWLSNQRRICSHERRLLRLFDVRLRRSAGLRSDLVWWIGIGTKQRLRYSVLSTRQRSHIKAKFCPIMDSRSLFVCLDCSFQTINESHVCLITFL